MNAAALPANVVAVTHRISIVRFAAIQVRDALLQRPPGAEPLGHIGIFVGESLQYGVADLRRDALCHPLVGVSGPHLAVVSCVVLEDVDAADYFAGRPTLAWTLGLVYVVNRALMYAWGQ